MSVAFVPGRSHSAYRSRSGKLILSLLALCSLVYDGFVFQTHLHPLHRSAAVSGFDRQVAAAIIDEECALCIAAAAVEPFLPAAPGIFVAPAILAGATIFSAPTYPALSSRAHIWRSRAPPGPVSLS